MIQLTDISFQYKESPNLNSLESVNLKIEPGEVVVLCGESGSGKTTLTRLINGLIPNFYEGELTGSVKVFDRNPVESTVQEMSLVVGSVFQNPRSQFFCSNTTSELAFQCENRGLDRKKIIKRISYVTKQLNFSKLINRNIFELSGGEKQKIACGSVAVSDNSVYVLDEPSSNLDLKAINELRQMLLFWKKQGKTIIISEHRLSYLVDIADRLIYMKEGRIEKEIFHDQLVLLSNSFLNSLGLRSIWMENIKCESKEYSSNSLIEIKNFEFCYNKKKELDISIPSLSIPKGSITAVVGFNGAGKSTFANCFCGLEKRCKGVVIDQGKLAKNKERLKKSYIVMQDVNHQLFTESVLDEILLDMKEKKESDAFNYLSQVGVEKFSERHPLSLSGGQKQRVALASALSSDREYLFFDEPTSGLDYKHMEEVSLLLTQIAKKGKTIFVISHDFELIAKCCNYYLTLEEGKVKNSGHLVSSKLGNIKKYFV